MMIFSMSITLWLSVPSVRRREMALLIPVPSIGGGESSLLSREPVRHSESVSRRRRDRGAQIVVGEKRARPSRVESSRYWMTSESPLKPSRGVPSTLAMESFRV
ncbi:hypothetical protein DY000_02059355 [Brassica cretica]|uniref:Secreted protein n=1 Tax=Brassica cretica TaxID=69181 RepID=A0ABQ7AVW7_BRACR|nr:hypothetical protein DY000_02059355 [Brassica cretica]